MGIVLDPPAVVGTKCHCACLWSLCESSEIHLRLGPNFPWFRTCGCFLACTHGSLRLFSISLHNLRITSSVLVEDDALRFDNRRDPARPASANHYRKDDSAILEPSACDAFRACEESVLRCMCVVSGCPVYKRRKRKVPKSSNCLPPVDFLEFLPGNRNHFFQRFPSFSADKSCRIDPHLKKDFPFLHCVLCNHRTASLRR